MSVSAIQARARPVQTAQTEWSLHSALLRSSTVLQRVIGSTKGHIEVIGSTKRIVRTGCAGLPEQPRMAAAASEAPAAAAVPVGGDEEDREHIGVIDMSEAARNLWLIKVPASLVKAWEDAPDGEELGVMRVYDELAPGQKKPTVEVDIAEPAAKRARSMTKSFVPCELELKWKDDGPALAVLSQTEGVL